MHSSTYLHLFASESACNRHTRDAYAELLRTLIVSNQNIDYNMHIVAFRLTAMHKNKTMTRQACTPSACLEIG